ncbi:response regulator [Haloarculaceae archaeon H-GB2-1]|nr:response regulator [Haloarculaceae archaeon H-GB1-1]MEA5387550.1 response regulator [Haloarculaceae archaeon H-GB11]MEA5409032.1 response regulator [Haloarculaceae archaeon H-GB2-1]
MHTQIPTDGDLIDSLTVLYVDDNPSIAELTADAMEQARRGLTVETAFDGESALSLLADADFDGVISDFLMPGMDGLELLREIRSDHPRLPFVLFTTEDARAVASDALEAGATDFMEKTTGTQQYELLANRIAMAVDARRATERASDADDLVHSFLDDVLDTCEEGLLVVDAGGDVAWANRAATDYFGLVRAEVLGRAEDQLVRGFMQSAVDDGVAFAETVLRTPADGSTTEWTWTRGSEPETTRALRHWRDPITSGRYGGGHVHHFVAVQP